MANISSCSSQLKKGAEFIMEGNNARLSNGFVWHFHSKQLTLNENGKQYSLKRWLHVHPLPCWQHCWPKVRPKACGNSLDHTISVCPVTEPLFNNDTSIPLRHKQGQSSDLQHLHKWHLNVTLGPRAKTMRWNNKVPYSHCVSVAIILYEVRPVK